VCDLRDVSDAVLVRNAPVWTVALHYNDITIAVGDTISFHGDKGGYHDVVLLDSVERALTVSLDV
jgi:hypothetical protein